MTPADGIARATCKCRSASPTARTVAATKSFDESRVHDLIERLRQADLVVGFNVLNFDYHVLMGYTVLDLVHELPTADLMLDMESRARASPRSRRHRAGDVRRAENRRQPRRHPLVARRTHRRDRGILLLRRESDAPRARARLSSQGTFLSRSLRPQAAGGGRLGAVTKAAGQSRNAGRPPHAALNGRPDARTLDRRDACYESPPQPAGND